MAENKAIEEINEQAARLSVMAYDAATKAGADPIVAQGVAGNAHRFWLDVLTQKSSVEIMALRGMTQNLAPQ